MQDILDWMCQRPGGLETYELFHARMTERIAVDPRHAAAARLLAELAGRFADALDRQPLPASVDDAARDRLISLLERAIAVRDATAEAQLAFLNELAIAELTQ